MRKCFLLFWIVMYSVLITHAQELTVKSFVEKTNDLSASTQERKDGNGNSCALVKVQLATAGAQFSPNVVGSVAYKVNEYWVYLSTISKRLKVQHPNFLNKEIVFADYGIKLEAKTTYELVLAMPEGGGGPKTQVVTSQYLLFNVTPADAIVEVNGEVWTNNNGKSRKLVPFGDYSYSVQASNYHTSTGTVTVNDPNNKTIVDVNLKPAFGSIKILPTESSEDATVYIDNQKVGSVPYLGETIPSGSHKVRIVKAMYKSLEQDLTVNDGEVTEFSPRLSENFATVTLSVDGNAKIMVDDNYKGTGTWTGPLEYGDYNIKTQSDGHRPQTKVYTIDASSNNQTIKLTAPTPIYGSVNIAVLPDESEVYIDGKNVGTTPLFLQNILIGDHRLEVKKEGYNMMSYTITVKEGEICAVENKELTKVLPAREIRTESQSQAQGVQSTTFIDERRAEETEARRMAALRAERMEALEQERAHVQGLQSTKFTVNGVSFDMVGVEAGTFTMGGTSEQGSDAEYDEKPTHQVTLTHNYYIGKTEVTQALWKAVMGSNPSYFKGDNLPVECVSWNDCQTFISKLNAATGKRFRLPTEAEWEFAARGGKKSKGYKYSGGNILGNVAWYYDNSKSKTHAVGTKIPNELGIYDMSGNVYEWCSDWYGNYSSSSQTNPTGPSSGSYRVCRGGSWFSFAGNCRSSFRCDSYPDIGDYYLGLRLVLSE